MVRKLYLMRHGETLFNTQKRVQGWCDSPLTENGIEQAKQVAGYFQERGIAFDAVYSSTQERAVDTATYVSGREPVRLKGIKEMNFGSFEAQPEHLLPKARPGAKSFEDLLVPYGGEDIREVGKRVRQTIDHILTETTDQSILMVSHGAAMWGFVLKEGIVFPDGVRFPNCAICEFEVVGEELVMKTLINPITGEQWTF